MVSLMAIPYFLAISVVSHLVLLRSVSGSNGEENNIKNSCPSSFSCKDLGLFSFPLSNSSLYSSCGLFVVTCDGPQLQIQLGNGIIWYDIMEGISQRDNNTHFPSLHPWIPPDPVKQELLKVSSCHLFGNLSFSNSPSISYTITPNITFFKCNKNSSVAQHFEGFQNYTVCEDDGYHLYYKYPADDGNPTPPYLLRNCTKILLPFDPSKWSPNQFDPHHAMEQLNFSLEMHVSKDCIKCHEGGGQCPTENQESHCIVKKSALPKDRHLKLILCTAIPGGLFLLIGFLVCIIRRNKWNWNHLSSTFGLRNNTFGSKADIEENSIYFGIPIFSYEELKEATNNFDPTKELGDGGFGTVYHGKLRDGREVAVKRLYEHNYKRVTQFMNEIEILTCMRHRNLVSLYGCTSRHSRELLLVYEYIPNGTVADHLYGDRAKNGQLTWPVRMNIAIETASALSYLHASDIIHRDVKTNNILLDDNFCVKVADFGLSRLFPLDVSHVSTAPQGTPGYVDPEYHQCYQLTSKSDVYSFGVVLIELISSMPAVDINRHRHEINLANLAVNRIQNRAFNELIDLSLGSESDPSIERMTTMVAEVAFRCLQLEKEMRPTMDEVLETLKEIQEYKDDNTGEEIENVVGVLNRTRSSPSPEGDNVVLLRNSKVTSSPVSVTDSLAISASTASISSG